MAARKRKRRKKKSMDFFLRLLRFLAAISTQQFPELLEQRAAIVRPRAGFGVVLHAKDRQRAVAHPFERAVVEVDVGWNQVARQRLRVHREAVILRRDLDLLGALIQDGLIGAPMAELQFEGLRPE